MRHFDYWYNKQNPEFLAEKDIEMNRKVDNITHPEHKFGFITGFQYCYEWVTKTGL